MNKGVDGIRTGHNSVSALLEGNTESKYKQFEKLGGLYHIGVLQCKY